MNAQLTFDDVLKARADGRNAAAWSVVMDCYADIERYSRQIAAKTLTVQADELLNEAIVTIVTRFDVFDPKKANEKNARRAASKFCYWQVRRACTNLLRQAAADRRTLCGMNPAEPDALMFVEARGEGSPHHIEVVAQAARIMERATPEEREAIVSKAEGWTGEEVQEGLGIAMAARNQRLYRFRARIAQEGA